MNSKKIVQLIIVSLIIVVTAGVIYLSYKAQQVKTKPPIRAENTETPEYQPPEDKQDTAQWNEFNHAELRYSFRFPPEFRVEQRGKVGNIEDLVAVNYVNSGRQLTVVKLQLTDEAPVEQTVVSQSGKDNNGNEVLIFKIPFRETKTLTVIGTVYPTTGSSYRFSNVIQKIAQSVTVL